MLVMKEPVGILKDFSDIYNDGLRIERITNKSRRSKLERLRRDLGVDFYNLQNDMESITEFANKYMAYNTRMTAVLSQDGRITPLDGMRDGILGMSDGERMVSLLVNDPQLLFSAGSEYETDLDKKKISKGLRQEFENNEVSLSKNSSVLVQEEGDKLNIYAGGNEKIYIIRKEEGSKLNIYLCEHEFFKTIADKVLVGEGLTKVQLDHVKKRFWGTMRQQEIENGKWILRHSSSWGNFGIHRALYDWVIKVSQGLIPIQRCEAKGCKTKEIFLSRGGTKRFCSNACKMRDWRRKQGKAAAV